MKPAHELWQELNRNKYKCKICNFRSFNKNHYVRHIDSSKHFLLTEFKSECPRELRILIASFLPLYKLIRLKSIGPYALRLAWRRPAQYVHHQRVVLPSLVFGDDPPTVNLPVRSADGVYWTIDNGRVRPYGVSL